MTRVAVIGAGLAGLVVARELGDCSDVRVFEKSRGFGGRMATRHEGDFQFDHGAQFFTARSSEFRSFLAPMIEQGVVAAWHARFAEIDKGEVTVTRDWDDAYPHYVGSPRMNAIGGSLAAGLDIQRNIAVAEIDHGSNGWRLSDDEGQVLGRFDWVICAMPAAQTAALALAGSALQRLAKKVQMRSCFALMLGFDRPPDLPWQAALVLGADISWASVNSSKPGRPDPFTLVVHSTNAYADARIDQATEAVHQHLRNEVSAVLRFDCEQAAVSRLQRWRYANADKRDGVSCLLDSELRLGGCGDWFRHGRIEAAFSSAYALARQMRELLA